MISEEELGKVFDEESLMTTDEDGDANVMYKEQFVEVVSKLLAERFTEKEMMEFPEFVILSRLKAMGGGGKNYSTKEFLEQFKESRKK